jgi:hypothetical protein
MEDKHQEENQIQGGITDTGRHENTVLVALRISK